MTKFLPLLLAVTMIIPWRLQAQEELHYFSAGPYFALKAGVNGGMAPQGRRNLVAFNGVPDFGVSCFYPVSEESDLAFIFDLGYSYYAYDIKSVESGKVYNNRFGYISFATTLHYNGILAGFNFGLPANANFGEKIGTDKLNFMAELRVGYMYPLMLNIDDGSLNLYMLAGYMLTGIYDNFGKDDPLREYIPPVAPQNITNKFNPRAVSLLLGISYLMNLEI